MLKAKERYPPDNVKYDNKQLGKKWGEHKKDFPNMKNHNDYKAYADNIKKYAVKIIYDRLKDKYYYLKGNDLLRLNQMEIL